VTDWVGLGFLAIPIGYVLFYVWAFIFKIIPWLNIGLTEIVNLTLLQLIATFFFFTFGAFLFVVCLLFVIGVLLS